MTQRSLSRHQVKRQIVCRTICNESIVCASSTEDQRETSKTYRAHSSKTSYMLCWNRTSSSKLPHSTFKSFSGILGNRTELNMKRNSDYLTFHCQRQLWLKPENFQILSCHTKPTGVTIQMKAVDKHILMALFELVLFLAF